MIKVISVCHDQKQAAPLIYSLEKHNWSFEIIETPWKGFGTKLIATYEYLKSHPEIKQFIFCDAFDVVVMGSPDDFRKRLSGFDSLGMLISSEKGLWPPTLQPFERLYCHHPYKCKHNYPNSGLYYAQSRVFIGLMERFMPEYSTDDQFWMNMMYLHGKNHIADKIELNFAQHIFNSYSFIEDGEYEIKDGKVYHSGTSLPLLFLHGNGKQDMTKILELI